MNTMPTPANRRWLIVDDNPQVAELLAILLGSFGLAEVEHCTSSHEAYWRVRSGGFDLVVADRELPGLDGFALARWLRAESPGAKIILINARSVDLPEETQRRTGVCAVLPKPFSLSRLESVVRALACEASADSDSSTTRRAA